MQNNQINNIISNAKHKRIMKRVVAVLCVITVFLTSTVLRHEVIAKSHVATCGYPDHEHTLDCYSNSGELLCTLHVHTDACYQTEAYEPLEEAPEEIEFELGDDLEMLESAPEEIELALGDPDTAMEDEPTYAIRDQQVVLLSEMLGALNLNIDGIVSVEQVVEDDDTVYIDIQNVGKDYEIRPLASFDEIELAIGTKDDIVLIRLAAPDWKKDLEGLDIETEQGEAAPKTDGLEGQEVYKDAIDVFEQDAENLADEPVSDESEDSVIALSVEVEDEQSVEASEDTDEKITEDDDSSALPEVVHHEGDNVTTEDAESTKATTEDATVETEAEHSEDDEAIAEDAKPDAETEAEENDIPAEAAIMPLEDDNVTAEVTKPEVESSEMGDEGGNATAETEAERLESEDTTSEDAEQDAENFDMTTDGGNTSPETETERPEGEDTTEEDAERDAENADMMTDDGDTTAETESPEDDGVIAKDTEQDANSAESEDEGGDTTVEAGVERPEGEEVTVEKAEPDVEIAETEDKGEDTTAEERPEGEDVTTEETETDVDSAEAEDEGEDTTAEERPEGDDVTAEEAETDVESTEPVDEGEDTTAEERPEGDEGNTDAATEDETSADGETATGDDEAEGLVYTFGMEKTVCATEIMAELGIDLSAPYFSVSVSDHDAVKLSVQFNPYDCEITALKSFDAVTLTLKISGEQVEIVLRNPEASGVQVAAGEAMVSEDGRGSVVFNDAVTLPEGTALTVEAVEPNFDAQTQADIEAKVANALGDADVDIKWFDISLGEVHDAPATVTVENVLEEVPAADVQPVIIHVTDEGDVVIIEDVRIDENGAITFDTDGFSTFGLATPLSAGSNLLGATNYTIGGTLTVNVQIQPSSMSSSDRYLVFTPEHDHEYTFTFSNMRTTGTTKYFTLYRWVDNDLEEPPIGSEKSTTASSYDVHWDTKLEAGQTYYLKYKHSYSGTRSIYVKPTYANHTLDAEHKCVECGYVEPWYIEDGKLVIQTADVLNYTSATGAPWYSRRNEITEVEIKEGITSLRDNFLGDGTSSLYPNLGKATLPESLTSIGSNAFAGTGLTEVNLPRSVTSIGNNAFKNCASLEKAEFNSSSRLSGLPTGIFSGCAALQDVTLPKNLAAIGDEAFKGCATLPAITIPKNVTQIGNSAFEGCSNLASADLPRYVESIGNSAFKGCETLAEVSFREYLTSIGDSAYSGCKSLAEVEIPESVTSLGTKVFENCESLVVADLSAVTLSPENKLPDYTFDGCKNLKEVSLPEGMTALGDAAFRNCSNALERLELPDTVTSIGNNTFSGCTSFKGFNDDAAGEVRLPDGVTSVGESAFNNCDAIVSIDTNRATSIASSAFVNCDNLETAILGEGITALSPSMFLNDINLKTIVMNGPVTEIPNNAFKGCTSLERFDFPATLEKIGNSAFSGCTNLSAINFVESTKPLTIENNAFQRCTSLTEVTFPGNLAQLGTTYSAPQLTPANLPTVYPVFDGCTRLAKVNFTSAVNDIDLVIGDGAFKGVTALREVNFSDNLTKIGYRAFGGNGSGSGSTNRMNIEKVSFPENCRLKEISHYAFYNNRYLTALDLPEHVETIGGYAFYYCNYIAALDLPDGLREIGDYAFQNCSRIPQLDLPEGLETIGSYAFYNCTALKQLVMPSTVTTIKDNAFNTCTGLTGADLSQCKITALKSSTFYGCTSLAVADLPETLTSIGSSAFSGCTTLADVDMKDNITSIGEYAFQNCQSLKEIELSNALTTIGQYAFYNCTGMERITIPQFVTSVGSYAFNSCSRLEDMVWNAADCPMNAFTSGTSTRFTLTVGNNVDRLDSALANLLNGGANMLVFEGENDFTLPALKGQPYGLPRPLSELETGTYHADINGALYKIESTDVATLVYVPDGLVNYTIPATIATDKGDIPVTGVKENALYSAKALTSLTIEAPDAMNRVSSYAFANATHLASVNSTITTRSGAQALFRDNNPDAVQLFYNTALVDDSTPVVYGNTDYQGDTIHYGRILVEDPEDPDNPDGKATVSALDSAHNWNSGITVDIFQAGSTSRINRTDERTNFRRKENGEVYSDSLTRDANGSFLTFTGEPVQTYVQISNPSSDEADVPEGDKIRIYFQTDDGCVFSQYNTVGKVETYITAVDVRDEDGNVVYDEDGKKKTEEGQIIFVLHETDVKGVRYYEFDRPKIGETVNLPFAFNFPSPTTDGGQVKVWAEYVVATQEAQHPTADRAHVPVEKTHTIDFSTRRDPRSLAKSSSYSSPLSVTVKDENGIPKNYIAAHAYKIDIGKENIGNTPATMGRDNVSSIDVVDTMTLPEGIVVNPVILDEIEQGKLIYRGIPGSNQTRYIFSPTLNKDIFTFSASSNNNYRTPVLEKTEDGNLILRWTVTNPNANNAADGTEIASQTMNVTLAEGVLCLEGSTQPEGEIQNDVVTTTHYCYGEDEVNNARATYAVNIGDVKWTFSKKDQGTGKKRGETAPYTLTLSSTGVKPVTTAEIRQISDDIDAYSSYLAHYIDAAGIWTLFMEDDHTFGDKDLGDVLTLTISQAHLYGYNTDLSKTKDGETEVLDATWKSVFPTDGGEKVVTSQANTGYATPYSGTTSSDAYDKVNNAEFVFTKVDDEVHCDLKIGGVVKGSGDFTESTQIQAFFDKYGFFVTRYTQYKTVWDIQELGEAFSLPGGQSMTITIPARFKDVFMRLTGDTWERENRSGSESTYYYNSAYVNGSKSYAASGYHYWDARLDKNAVWAESDIYSDEYTKPVEYPKVLGYTVDAQHRGDTWYAVMPVTDHMTGQQALLVPVTENKNMSWATGLDTYPLNGVDYYILNGKGHANGETVTYDQVWTGECYADHVEVTRTGDVDNPYSTFDTKIFWYVKNFGGDSTASFNYLAKVEKNPRVGAEHITDYFNESWLGDHQSHRLWDSVSGYGGVYAKAPVVTQADKKIVSRVGDKSEGAIFSPITRGDTVVYRLRFANDTRDGRAFTLTEKDFYDILPFYYTGFSWTKANQEGEKGHVQIDYDGFTFNGASTKDDWTIVPSGSAYEQKIVWNEGFSMTCDNASGIGYVYVTLKFPDDTAWDEYVRRYQGGQLVNTLEVRDQFDNFQPYQVFHELGEKSVVRLQKGVYATGSYNSSSNSNILRYNANSRLTYENDDALRHKVFYYITLHNGGYTNLYLNEIQDVLPKGFTLANMPTGSSYANPRLDSSIAAVTKGAGDNTSLTLISSSYSRLTTRTETTPDGRTRVIMKLMPYTSSGKPQQNEYRADKPYYLAPGQYAVIRLECFTNSYEDTEDLETNVVSMPYYDFYDQGLELANSTSTSASINGSTQPEKNDGGCEVIDNTQAGGMCFNTAGYDGTTQWLMSGVDLTRGNIKPGLNKTITDVISKDEYGRDVSNGSQSIVGSHDRLVWKLDARNEGDSAIIDYALTDVLPAPYNFSSGTVTFQQKYNNGTNLGLINLFDIERELEDDGDEKRPSDSMKLIPYNSNGNKTTAVNYTIGDGPVEVKLRNVDENQVVYVDISLDAGGNEVLNLRFPGARLGVPSDGRVEVKFTTMYMLEYLRNMVIINKARFTPLNQSWTGMPDVGNLIEAFETPYKDDPLRSVASQAQVICSNGGSTDSIKKIEEKEDTSNHTDSRQSENWITVRDKSRLVTYTLSVQNLNNQGVKHLVLIDNLPQPGDRTAFQPGEERYSQFRVMLADNPNFTLKVHDFINDRDVVIDSAKYYIEWSEKNLIADKDWDGAPSSDWTRWDVTSLPDPISKVRAIRLVYQDQPSTGERYLFKASDTISLTFNGQIEDGAQPGDLAWNGFGYSLMLQNGGLPFKAAPLLVGVRIPNLPHVVKRLVNARGVAHRAESNLQFKYALYSGNAIGAITDSITEAQIMEEIKANRRDYALLTVTVPKGSTQSADNISFNDADGYFYNAVSGKYETSDWYMKDNSSYTLIELPPEGQYMPRTLDGKTGRSSTFTFKAAEDSRTISSVNTHNDWSIQLRKEDQFKRPIGGVLFAIYTSIESEAMTAEAYAALTTEAIQEQYGVTLEQAPAYHPAMENGADYSLKALCVTSGMGVFQLDELTGASYVYQELWAPGEYVRDSTPKSVSRDGDSMAIKKVTVQNTYAAADTIWLKADKQMIGRPLKDGETYRFRLEGFDIETGQAYTAQDYADATETGTRLSPLPANTETNNTDTVPDGVTLAEGEAANIFFGPINMTADDIGKTYYYRVSEIFPEGDQRDEMITYDGTKYIIRAVVTDEGQGKLGVDLRYSWFDDKGEENTVTGEVATFRNRYTDSRTITLPVSKTLSGRNWYPGDTYTFTLTTDDERPGPMPENLVLKYEDDVEKPGEHPLKGQFTLEFTQDYEGGEYTYELCERVPDNAVAYDARTEAKLRVKTNKENGAKGDLKYERYRQILAEDDLAFYGLENVDIIWKQNGMFYDGTRHTLKVSVAYDPVDNRLHAEATFDDKPLDEGATIPPIPFVNRFTPDPISAKVEVEKRIEGRQWLFDEYDSYTFKIIPDPADQKNVPMPEKDTVTITNSPAEISSEAFTIPLKWSHLDEDVGGAHQQTREFTYKVVELDKNGNPVTEGYKDDQVTYDAAEHIIKITLTDAGNNSMTRKVEYWNYDAGEGEWLWEPSPSSFVNRYKREPVPLPIRVSKRINDKSARQEGYTFDFDAFYWDGTPMDTLKLTTGKENGGDIEKKIGAVMFDISEGEEDTKYVYYLLDEQGETPSPHVVDLSDASPETFRFYLRERIPDDAAGYDADGKPIEALTYGTASAEQKANPAIRWIKDSMTYDSGRIDAEVIKVTLDEDSARVVPTIVYTRGTAQSGRAQFNNTYVAKGRTVLNVSKTITGEGFDPEKKFHFELIAQNGAPLRTQEGLAEDGKLTIEAGHEEEVSFDELLFLIDDLMKADGGWDEKTFNYTIHEVIPPEANAFNADNEPLNTEGTVYEGEGELLTYGSATPEQRQSPDILWKSNGYFYDHDQNVAITVRDEGNGVLSVICGEAEPGRNFSFTNQYQPNSAEVVFRVQKVMMDAKKNVLKDWTMEGHEDWANMEFSFKLTPLEYEEGKLSPKPKTDTVTLKRTKKTGSFGKVRFDKAGTYYYEISEVLPEPLTHDNPVLRDASLLYDNRVHRITVKVTDPNTGTLKAEVRYDDTQEEELPPDAMEMPEESGQEEPVVFVNRELMSTCEIEVVKKWILNGEEVSDPLMASVDYVPIYLYRKSGEDGIIERIDGETLEAISNDDTEREVQPFRLTKDVDSGKWKLVIRNLPNYAENGEGNLIVYRYFINEGPVSLWKLSDYFDGTTRVLSGAGGSMELIGGGNIEVTNSMYSVSLPATGGPGTRFFTLSGITLIALALAMLFRRRKV